MQIHLSTGSGSSRFGAIFGVLISALFTLIGLGLIGYGGMQWISGASLGEWLPFLGVGGMFAGMSVFSIVRILRARTAAREAEARASSVDPEAPWAVRAAWTSDVIEEDGDRHTSTVFFAVVWNLMAWPIASFALYEAVFTAADPEWGVLFVLVFPAVGLFLGWKAVQGVLHARKYGATHLVMDTMPARLGGRLEARLQTGMTETPEGGVHVRLSCYRRRVRWTTDSDGDSRKEVKRDLKWRDEKYVRTRTYDAAGHQEVPLSFRLPDDLPPATMEKRENRIQWVVETTADVPGIDFQSQIEIPVVAPDPSAYPDESAQAGGGVAEDDESVYWSDDGIAHAETEPPADEAADPYEVGARFTEPVSSGIQMERLGGGGVRFDFSAGRNLTAALLFTAFGGVLLAVAYLLVTNGSLLGGGLFGLFGGLLMMGAWQQWTHRTTVTVEDGTVTVKGGSFGTGTYDEVPVAAVDGIDCEPTGHSGSTTYYALRLRHTGESSQKADDGSRKLASMLAGSGLVGDEAAAEIREHVNEAAASIQLADNLTNKAEADWISAEILRATERERAF